MSDIEALQHQIEEARAVVEQRDLMSKLANNHEFRKLIIEGFCRDECARFLHVSTDPNIAEDDRRDALGSAQAAGYLKRWMNALIMMGNHAASGIVEMQEMIAELRAEGQED